MKVYIGKQLRHFGGYELAELLTFWARVPKTAKSLRGIPDWVYDFGWWLSSDKHDNDSKLQKLLYWIDSKRKRKIKIRIDDYDLLDTTDTLAIVILAVLKKFNEINTHSYATTLDRDAPPNLSGEEFAEARWRYIVDEMIWTFDYISNRKTYGGGIKEEKRKDNGLRLFAKYFNHLWD